MVRFVHSSCSSEASRGCSGVNKHVYFGLCLFLRGVREVPESSHTSTAIGSRLNDVIDLFYGLIDLYKKDRDPLETYYYKRLPGSLSTSTIYCGGLMETGTLPPEQKEKRKVTTDMLVKK